MEIEWLGSLSNLNETLGMYLHDNKKVKHQDERSQEGSWDLITWQKSTIQLVPADPVSSDDKHNYRGQSKQNCPAREKK